MHSNIISVRFETLILLMTIGCGIIVGEVCEVLGYHSHM